MSPLGNPTFVSQATYPTQRSNPSNFISACASPAESTGPMFTTVPIEETPSECSANVLFGNNSNTSCIPVEQILLDLQKLRCTNVGPRWYTPFGQILDPEKLGRLVTRCLLNSQQPLQRIHSDTTPSREADLPGLYALLVDEKRCQQSEDDDTLDTLSMMCMDGFSTEQAVTGNQKPEVSDALSTTNASSQKGKLNKNSDRLKTTCDKLLDACYATDTLVRGLILRGMVHHPQTAMHIALEIAHSLSANEQDRINYVVSLRRPKKDQDCHRQMIVNELLEIAEKASEECKSKCLNIIFNNYKSYVGNEEIAKKMANVAASMGKDSRNSWFDKIKTLCPNITLPCSTLEVLCLMA